MREALKRYARGEVPLGKVFLHDMLLVGTIVNILTGGAALMAFALGLPGWLALAIFFAPLPYNISLCVFVWQSASRATSRWSVLARVGSILWLLVVLII